MYSIGFQVKLPMCVINHHILEAQGLARNILNEVARE